MRNRLIVTALLASTLSACGSGSSNNTTTVALSTTTTASTAVEAAPTKTTATKKPTPAKLEASWVAPQKRLKTTSGKGPAVVLLPDTGNRGGADAEAQKLAKLGVGALVVVGPSAAPTQVTAFNQAVTETLLAVKKLRSTPGVDPDEIGIVGEGVGAHVGAVAIGRDPTAISAAVLADIGGVVVPSPKFAPDRWLRRAEGIQLLFQRDQATRAMTKAEITKLMLAAPPGTLMEQYDKLGAQAQAARDSWIRQKLLAS
jgi:dienelactone hydrolase